MIYAVLWQYPNVMMGLGLFFIFISTILCLSRFKDKLPADEGRDFAVDGKLSKGKPRGAGIVFVLSFAAGVLLFSPIRVEYLIYVGLVVIEMITGFLDDKADVSWGRTKKGILDLFVAVCLAVAYIYFNGTRIYEAITAQYYTLPVWLFFILIVALVWCSINVTNCADGVDGLSGTLTIITLLSFYLTDLNFVSIGRFSYMILFFVASLVAYLWFNATPSILMMGDAGSRAMGVFIAIVALKSRMPLLYIPFALILLLDGGLGLLKVSVIKLTGKKTFMNKLRTPLHDHVRKNLSANWSNTQCVFRFAIIQFIVSILTMFILLR